MQSQPRVIAYHARSGIGALNVVTGALEADPRTAGMDVVFVKTPAALAAACASAPGPVVVAWSFYSPDFTRMRGELEAARSMGAHALHVAGGVHATAEPRATLAAGWDLVAVGEGEATFVEIVAAVARGASPRVRGTAWLSGKGMGTLESGGAAPRLPLDAFPACNLRFGLWNALEITRGCIYACSFCQTPFMFKARFRHRSVDDVRRHVRAMARGGLRYVRFVTPTALSYGTEGETPDLAAVEDLLRTVRAELPEGGKIYFGTFPSEVRPEHVTPDALAVIARWCDNRSLVIGGQSGSARVLDATHRGHDVASIERAVDVAIAHGFRPDVDFLLGLPEEDSADRTLSIALAERLAARGARIHAHAFMPLPGTPLAASRPTEIEPDVAAAVARLESRGAAYGQWRAQQAVANELVQLRRTRPPR
ncbi:MAG TPA: TIGR04013 family B12-binding domain/radical SAM domain-containing protein [Kofleriaceae bacterium]|nr:TIGR04013 family B12-binding domain/radical SAM domain-containing protein [Kofleriaceae bacterium]